MVHRSDALSDIEDIESVKEMGKQATEWMKKVEWCDQHGVLPRLPWPLLVYMLCLCTGV